MNTEVCAATRRIEAASLTLMAGKPVLIVSGTGSSQSASVAISASLASTRWTAWAVRHTSGLLCAAVPSSRADELELPAMVRGKDDGSGTPAFAIGVDAAEGIGTGISATDRTRTVRVIADPRSRPEDLTRPGHVLPLRTAPRGAIEQDTAAEAAVDLCAIALLEPVALTATLVNDDGTLTRSAALENFTRDHRVPLVHVRDVVHHRVHHGDGRVGRVREVASQDIDVPEGTLRVSEFKDEVTDATHFAYFGGGSATGNPKVYVIVECAHRDPLALGCACQQVLETRRAQVAGTDGVVIYVRPDPWPSRRYAVPEKELTQGAITSILTTLGVAGANVNVWPGNQGWLPSCGQDVSPRVRDTGREVLVAH